jgi:hypothetical protein
MTGIHQFAPKKYKVILLLYSGSSFCPQTHTAVSENVRFRHFPLTRFFLSNTMNSQTAAAAAAPQPQEERNGRRKKNHHRRA